MVYWQKFNPEEFEYEFDEAELAGHAVTVDEVIEVFWNGFQVRRNKRYHEGYQIIGYTDGGRKLKLIAYEKQKAIRVITGWGLRRLRRPQKRSKLNFSKLVYDPTLGKKQLGFLRARAPRPWSSTVEPDISNWRQSFTCFRSCIFLALIPPLLRPNLTMSTSR